MMNDLHATTPSESRRSGLTLTRVLVVVILIAVLYLLAEDMVGHRFFRGGWISHQDTLMP